MSDSDMFDPIKTDEQKQTSALSFHHQMFSITLYKIAHFKTQVFCCCCQFSCMEWDWGQISYFENKIKKRI